MPMVACPKCGGTDIDEGLIVRRKTILYKSKNYKGLFGGLEFTANACPNCGYVEFYVDGSELRKQLGK